MKLICHLRVARGSRTLREISEASGVRVPELSMIERGQLLPKDEDLERLASAYGVAPTEWYEKAVLLAVSSDDAVPA